MKTEHWRSILLQLEKAEQEIKATQDYKTELEALKCLQELVKEQMPYESTDYSSSAIR